jgi:predicted DNA-binding protein with PD1-like motif/carbonic anhydrase/acetyltransferase-like protein (isoleucine patch superfamily)
MKYSRASMGRAFVLRLENGEVVHEQIEAFARAQKILAASVAIIGGADEGSVLVVGPARSEDRPISPMVETLRGVHEAVGVGMLVPDGDGNPHVHMHLACGRKGSTVTGCIRKGVKAWQTMEVFIQELLGISARRLPDAALGFGLLEPLAGGAAPDVNIHPTARVHPTAILEGRVTVGACSKIFAGAVITGDVTIGHHTMVHCNATLRGTMRIGNLTHIYDNVNIEGGRPAGAGSSTAEVPDQAIIGDNCWVNHGAVMHGTQLADRSAVGLSACCDYDTRLGVGAVLANGSATRVGQRIPDNAFAEGVPARVVKENITDKDRAEYFGLIPVQWTRHVGERLEKEGKA